MTRPSVELCPATQEVYFEGPAVRAAGWRVHPRGLHCVSMRVNGFRGAVHIEGTLDTNSSNGKWFPVVEPIQFPRTGVTGESATLAVTFTVNCIWLRVRVDRRMIVMPNTNPEFIARMVGRFEGARLGI